MEAAEAESEAIARRREELYQEFRLSDSLHMISGGGEYTASVFLAAVGDPVRFCRRRPLPTGLQLWQR